MRVPLLVAGGAGVLLGWAIFLNYGLALIAFLALAVLITAVDWHTALRTLVPAAADGRVRRRGVLRVRASGGSTAIPLCRNAIGRASRYDRPFQYWSWANFASVVCAIGLGSVAGIGRAFDIAAIRRRPGLHLLVLGALLAIVCADLSMLSKAETERIWLPFTIWLTAAAALLPPQSHRWWLALNVVGALALNSFILTNW